jgi:hypothetical protein
MARRNRSAATAVTCGLFLFGAATLVGQVTDSIPAGAATHSSGAAIAGADVTGAKTQTGGTYPTVITNCAGEYPLSQLPLGQYVAASDSGYAAATLIRVDLRPVRSTRLERSRNVCPLDPNDDIDDFLSKTLTFKGRFGFEFGGQEFNLFHTEQLIPRHPYELDKLFRAGVSVKFLFPANPCLGRDEQFLPSSDLTVRVVGRFVF